MAASQDILDLAGHWQQVLDAHETVGAMLPVTPAWSYPMLNLAAGCEVVVKHENGQPTGAFKVRGGVTLAARLDSSVTTLVTASTGNHAQSVAFAARSRGIAAIVVMPESSPANKVEATRLLGAQVISHGESMTEAGAHARELVERQVADGMGWRFVDVAEPDIIHGHATLTLELLEGHPDLEAVYIPIGSGTSAAGACIVREGLGSGCRIVGVQSAQAPAAHDAWHAGEPRTAPCTTRVSGLATASSYDLPQQILRGRLDDFLLVDDDAIDQARRLIALHAHTLAEGAGAAALAGLLADPNRPQRCAVVLSGGNADARELATLYVAD